MPKGGCLGRKPEGGLSITTFTGDSKENIICEINTRRHVKHWVRVRNLRAYHTIITCSGQITSDPRYVRFVSSKAGDTEEQWVGKYMLDSYEEYAFSHVSVLSSPPYGEKQKITVQLEIDRMQQRGLVEGASLSIDVWS